VIDTGQRPTQVDLKVLSEGCDLLIIPAVPASLDTDGLVLMLQALYDIDTDRYRVLLTKVPPPPEPDGPQLRSALTAQGVPLFAVDIPRLKAFEGSVSKVEMAALIALIYKALFPSISTFETPPSGGIWYFSDGTTRS
jgi:chromosome partitioning protein